MSEMNNQSWPETNSETEKMKLQKMAEKLGGTVYDLMKRLGSLNELLTSDGRGAHISVNHMCLVEVGELFAEAMELERAYAERRRLTDPNFGK